MVKNNDSKEEVFFKKIISKIQEGTVLDSKELDFINSNSKLPDEVKTQFNLINKQNSGEQLSSDEKKILEQIQESQQNQSQNSKKLPLSLESRENLERFKRIESEAEFEINHITDLHATPMEFESLLIRNLSERGHLVQNEKGIFEIKKNVAIAITGDIGTDFFDKQREGLETFLSKNIVKKAGFNNNDAKEFIENYTILLEFAGIDEVMIKENHQMLLGEEGNPLRMFEFGYLFGAQDPRFLTKEQKKKFKEAQRKVQKLLKKGIKHHAKKEYSAIKEILSKYNLTPDKLVMVSGNHDVPEIFNDVLGDYVLTPGKIREINGIKFGNIVESSNGNFTMGSDFNDVFGYSGLKEESEEFTFNTEAFKLLQNNLKKNGIEFENKELKTYMDNSIQRAAQGIGSGDLGKYFKNKIAGVLRKHIDNNLKNMEKNIPYGADVILNHSVLDLQGRAGLEEIMAHNLISQKMKPSHGNGMLVLGGHEHKQSSHIKEGVYHINPGSVQSGNSAVHLLNKDKSYNSSLFKSSDENNNDIYRHLLNSELPNQSSGKVKD